MTFKHLTTRELLSKLNQFTFKQLHIHHTWRPNHSNFNTINHDKIQHSMKNYHINTNKWSDIGQHVSLFPDGVWVVGREPFSKAPASIKGWNTGAFAVEMIGNFDKGNDRLEKEQLNSILELIKYFIDKYGEQSIKFHREGPGVKKTCPGTSLSKSELIRQAKNLGGNKDMYRVRKSWENEDSQIGAYTDLNNAISQARSLGSEYKVFNEKGFQMFPESKHWADKHFESLKNKGYSFSDKRFNDFVTRGEVFAMIDRITNK